MILITNNSGELYLSFDLGSMSYLWVPTKEAAYTFESEYDALAFEDNAEDFLIDEPTRLVDFDTLKSIYEWDI
jgi:hypothetical protein